MTRCFKIRIIVKEIRMREASKEVWLRITEWYRYSKMVGRVHGPKERMVIT